MVLVLLYLSELQHLPCTCCSHATLAILLCSCRIETIAVSEAHEAFQWMLSERHGYLCSLTDPPQDGSTLHLTADIISQRGNAIDVAQHVILGPREQFFTAATYGVQYTTVVNVTGAHSSLVHQSMQPWTLLLRAAYCRLVHSCS